LIRYWLLVIGYWLLVHFGWLRLRSAAVNQGENRNLLMRIFELGFMGFEHLHFGYAQCPVSELFNFEH
jgi:hypothetical protein